MKATELLPAGTPRPAVVAAGSRSYLSYVLRIGRSPRTIARILADRILVPLRLQLHGVEVGGGCLFVGQPVVTRVPGARISLGKEVCLFSRFDSNPAGLPHPTILSALTPESLISIGDCTSISGASIAARVTVTIGNRVMIGAGACIWDTDFHPVDPHQRHRHPTQGARCAPVAIHDDVFIGARAMILKGVTVGWGAVIGAGAVVTKDVKACQVVAGNPAVVVGISHSKHEAVWKNI